MNGAESLVHSLLKSGIEVCFANPGTSEMHFVAALDRVPGMRCVLGLQENIVTGAADGYYRISGTPAVTLLHCGPGLANGLAGLHDARRAHSGIVNCVGDQATYHRPLDAPLTADTEGFARGVSAWVRTSTEASEVGQDVAVAVQAARTSPGQVATLILPSDTCWNDGGQVAEALPVPGTPQAEGHAIRNAAKVLREKKNVLILLGGPTALTESGQIAAQRIVAHTGAHILAETSNAKIARGQGRMQLDRVPYPPEQAVERLKGYGQIILVGSRAPVGFFGYPNYPSIHYSPKAEITVLTRQEQDAVTALTALAEELGAPKVAMPDNGSKPDLPRGAPSPEGLARVIAALMPEQAIIVDESVTYGRGLSPLTHCAAKHDWLQNRGGAIGYGFPVATGAAVAGGGRRVIALQADGSGMYTVQALWTQAREKLPITTIVLSNRKYQILIGEYRNVGANPGPTAMQMLDLGNPDINWVQLANGMGVEAATASTLEELADLVSQSLSQDNPFLIEFLI